MARAISKFSWCSTAPVKCWTCPVQVRWKLVTSWRCTSPLQRSSSVWASSQMCWGEYSWCRCFSAESLHWPSRTVPVSCSAANWNSHTAVQTSPRSHAGREATSTRSTNGCGALWGASLAWGVCHCLRLRCCEWLWSKKGLVVVMPSRPTWKGGAMLWRRRRPKRGEEWIRADKKGYPWNY